MKRENIGAKIKAARKKLGWSQERLAEASGVVTRTLQDIEYGTSKEPSFNRIMAIAAVISKATGSPISSLIGIDPKADKTSKQATHLIDAGDLLKRIGSLGPERRSLVMALIYDDPLLAAEFDESIQTLLQPRANKKLK